MIDRIEGATFKLSNVNVTLCTHYVYAYATLNQMTYEINSNDLSSNSITAFTAFKTTNPKLKLLIALGGPEDSGDVSGKYSKLVADPSNIKKMVSSAVTFLKTYNFDGLSVDWLYPKSTQDQIGYANLISALKTTLLQNGFLLGSSVSALQTLIDGIH